MTKNYHIRGLFPFFFLLLFFFSCKNRELRETKYENGQLKSQIEVVKTSDGSFAKDGKYVLFYKNGQKEEEGTYADNELSGEATQWHENGKVANKMFYEKGKLEGKHERYNQDGLLLYKFEHKKGNFDGECEAFYGGKLKVRGTFVENLPNGTWLLFDENNKQIASVEMDKGKHKSQVVTAIEGNKYAETISLLGFELGNSTYPQVKLGLLENSEIPIDLGTNRCANGATLSFSGEAIALPQLTEVKCYFNDKGILVGMLIVMPKNKSTKYGAGFGAGFREVNSFLKKKYKLLAEKIPFVGNTYSKYRSGNSFVFVDAPHMSFEMTTKAWVEGYEGCFE